MIWLIVGLVLFFDAHLVPMVPALRNALVGAIGENGCKGLVAVTAFAGLGLIVFGYSRAGYTPVYTPPPWGMDVAKWLMLPVFPLLVAAYQPSNIKRVTRHPMLWATVLWALAHLSANGDAASVLLFGSFGVWALLAMYSANRRGATLKTESVPVVRDVVNAGVGLAVHVLVAYFHGRIFGMPSGVF